MKRLLAISAVATLAAGLSPVRADTTESFYKGRTVELVIGYATGGSNDTYARLLSMHMGRHIPGAPSMIVRNMPGAGSFVAVNTVYSNSPRDGTIIGLGAPTIALDEKLGTTGVRFKTSELNWIGRTNSAVNIVMTWKTSPVKTIEDAFKRDVTLAGTGAGSTVSIYPNVMNGSLGTRFKLIMGYRGSSEAMLAMERGEAEGHSTSWEAVKTAHPAWLTDGSINNILQFALKRHPEMPNVPTALDVAKTDEQRDILRAVLNATEVGASFFTTPGAPEDRVAALRKAFDDTMKDPELLKDAEKMRMDIQPLSGADVQKLIASVADLSPAVVDKVRAVYAQGN
ncbi:MAG: tripartite tricarboxylate transporter family receptor [Hyphomicrobiales bacterium]|nr:tripartite tricarboxylate transporter family receptor [Hyphomicrobiales bacterium]